MATLPCAPPSPPPPAVASPSQPPPSAPPTDTCVYTQTNRPECACGETWTLSLRDMVPAWDLTLAWPADRIRLQYAYQGLYNILGPQDTILYASAADVANDTTMIRTPATPPTSGYTDVVRAKVPGERFAAGTPLVSLRYPHGSIPAFPKPNGGMVNGYIGWLMGADTGNFHTSSMVERIYDTTGQALGATDGGGEFVASVASCWFKSTDIDADYFYGIQNPVTVLTGSSSYYGSVTTTTFSVRVQAFHTRPMLKSVNFRIHIDPSKVAFRYACIGPEPNTATCRGPLASTLGVHQAVAATSTSSRRSARGLSASAGTGNYSGLPPPAADSMPLTRRSCRSFAARKSAWQHGSDGQHLSATSFPARRPLQRRTRSMSTQAATRRSITQWDPLSRLWQTSTLTSFRAHDAATQHEVMRLEACPQGQTVSEPPRQSHSLTDSNHASAARFAPRVDSCLLVCWQVACKH